MTIGSLSTSGFVLVAAVAACAHGQATAAKELDTVVVDRDNVVVERSCRLLFPATPILDHDGNGVVQVVGDDITVDLGGATLRGAPPSTPLDGLAGFGIVVTGDRVRISNGSVRGFRCAIRATESHGSTFEKLTLAENYAMHLQSTPSAEASEDWLWPHENDNQEWVTRYGAALCIERSDGVTVRDVTVRSTQNGIILDRVNGSKVYDNDCSFLSGWGLAMWRSSENVVCRNAFDFCIRGYSHGVYNRGQDSAGILIFEQCSKNTIALNSATHGGDGIFGFAGKEALGEKPAPSGAADDFHLRRGTNDNLFVGNDLSYAAAHGLEMTFSFGNRILANRFVENGICGVWAGYSADTLIAFNTFERNGPRGTGEPSAGEGGAIDIEHGRRNVVRMNDFADEATAIEFWWDADEALRSRPWAKANGVESADNVVSENRFVRTGAGVGLRETQRSRIFGNTLDATFAEFVADKASDVNASAEPPLQPLEKPSIADLEASLPGLNRPVGARRALGGREAIIMTAFGPWDHTEALLTLARAEPNRHLWRLIGATGFRSSQVLGSGSLRINRTANPGEWTVTAEKPGHVMPYEAWIAHDSGKLSARGCIMDADWQVTFFPSPCDPRNDLATWREGATGADSVVVHAPALNFRYGTDGPKSLSLGDLATETLGASTLPADGFGMVAKTKVRFPKGSFTLRVTSDDGVRVLVDGQPVIEDWTWHPPRESRAQLAFSEPKEVELTVEHFELDGVAELTFFVDGEYVAPTAAPRKAPPAPPAVR
jgi:hypothetical protein